MHYKVKLMEEYMLVFHLMSIKGLRSTILEKPNQQKDFDLGWLFLLRNVLIEFMQEKRKNIIKQV